MPERYLFVIDLDGTALGGGQKPYSRFTDEFADFLDEIAANNWQWAINSTWDPSGQLDLCLNSRLQSRPTFLMAEFGLKLARVIRDDFVYDEKYCSSQNEILSSFQADFNNIIFRIINNFPVARIFHYGHLCSITIAQNADLLKFAQQSSEWIHDDRFIWKVLADRISFRPAFMQKGNPLQALINSGELTREQIVAAGDEAADLSMMSPTVAGGGCICPCNASEEVKIAVHKFGGEVSNMEYSAGVINGFDALSSRRNWDIRNKRSSILI